MDTGLPGAHPCFHGGTLAMVVKNLHRTTRPRPTPIPEGNTQCTLFRAIGLNQSRLSEKTFPPSQIQPLLVTEIHASEVEGGSRRFIVGTVKHVEVIVEVAEICLPNLLGSSVH